MEVNTNWEPGGRWDPLDWAGPREREAIKRRLMRLWVLGGSHTAKTYCDGLLRVTERRAVAPLVALVALRGLL